MGEQANTEAVERSATLAAVLAAHLDATRAIERHGVATAAETLQAFAALPPPTGQSVTQAASSAPQGRAWFEVLQCAPIASEAVIQASYRALAKTYAGDEAKLLELNLARDEGLRVLAS